MCRPNGKLRSAQMATASRFPKDCPSDCPPDAAQDATSIVYRTVKANPPTAEDFLSYLEEGKRVSKAKRCGACGLSVMLSLEDARHHRDVLPWLSKFVSRGTLCREHGKTMPTPSDTYPTHAEWWPYEGVERHTLFTVVDGE
jgi:hypothetical protein